VIFLCDKWGRIYKLPGQHQVGSGNGCLQVGIGIAQVRKDQLAEENLRAALNLLALGNQRAIGRIPIRAQRMKGEASAVIRSL
jgi:hypothetical protein